MMFGVFRDEHPRITLSMPGLQDGFEVEFIVDTGYAGDLAMPLRLARQLDSLAAGTQERLLATGQPFQCSAYEIMLDWNGENRTTEVLVLEGEPLLGTVLMREYLIQMEMTDGGEIVIEPL